MKVAVCALDEHSQKLEGGELVTTRGYRALSGGHETLPPTLVFFYSLLPSEESSLGTYAKT